MEETDALALLTDLGIAPGTLTHRKGSFDKDIFLVDQDYVLRPSAQDMAEEHGRFVRIGGLEGVPRIVGTGLWVGHKPWHYLVLSQIRGREYHTTIPSFGEVASDDLGRTLAGFLDRLHAMRGPAYDLGHYIPLFPGFDGSWKEGHRRYQDWLREEAAGLSLPAAAQGLVSEAFTWMEAHHGALDFQAGPVLLHNDFHPRNIIVDGDRFSGVIDWECSQYGEADFDLCHLFHWCLFPMGADYAFERTLGAMLEAGAWTTRVPRLAERLTIYQMEHELIQLIWSRGAAWDDRRPRLEAWLGGGIEDVMERLSVTEEGA